MRLVAVAAGLALAAAAAPAVAEGARPELASGEVLLETATQGSVRTPATKVTVTIAFYGKGATAADARRAGEALAQRLLGAARAAGIDAADLRITHPPAPLGFVGNEAEAPGLTVYAPASAGPVSHRAVAWLVVLLRDASRYERLRSALEAAGAEDVPPPEYDLVDDRPARRAAKADALARSRAEAEASAAALGMRVARLLRVSERGGVDTTDPADILNYMKALRGGGGANEDGKVETNVRIAVDYALVPR